MDTYFSQSRRAPSVVVVVVFVFVFSRRRGGGEEEEEGEEAPTSTFQKCWEVYGLECVCLLSFLFFLFSFNFFPPKKKALSTTTPFHRLQKTQKKCLISDSNRPPKGTLLRHTRLKIGAITWSTRWRREMR